MDGDREDELSMRQQIVDIVVTALRKQAYPDLTLDSVRTNPAHREAFIDMLEDCRPLPVIKQLIADARARTL